MTELELVRWGTARIANLQWSMGDADGADEVLKLLCSKLTHPGLRLLVDGDSHSWASLLFENQLDAAVCSTANECSQTPPHPRSRSGGRSLVAHWHWR